MSVLSIVWIYVLALFHNWIIYLTGLGPIVVDSTLQILSKGYRQWAAGHGTLRKRALIFVLIGGVYWTGFEAFQEQYKLAQNLEPYKTELEGIDGKSGLKKEKQDLDDKINGKGGYLEQITTLRVDLNKAHAKTKAPSVASPVQTVITVDHVQRHLSDEQRALLTLNLKSLASDVRSVGIWTEGWVPEITNYADDFSQIFKTVGIGDGNVTVGASISGNDRGVFVGVSDLKNPPEIALRFLKALQTSGISAQLTLATKIELEPPIGNDTFVLLVGVP